MSGVLELCKSSGAVEFVIVVFYNLGYKRGSVYDNVLFVDCNCYFRVISSMIGLTSSRWLDLYFKYGSRSDWSLNCLIP